MSYDQEFGKAFFDKQVKKYGTHSRSQGFSYPISQITQFQSVRAFMPSVSEHNPITLLDLAGGIGDLLLYLRSSQPTHPIKGYSCIDNQLEMLEKAKRRAIEAYGVEPMHFGEELFDPSVEMHDYVVCVGLYAMWTDSKEKMIRHVEKMLGYMTSKAKKGLSINFITPWSDYVEEYHRPLSPVVPIRILKQLGWERVTVDASRAPHLYMVHAVRGEYPFRKDWGKKEWDIE